MDGVVDRGHVGAVGFQQQHAARRLFTPQQSTGRNCGLSDQFYCYYILRHVGLRKHVRTGDHLRKKNSTWTVLYNRL
jgi:hypothetical protein